MISIVMMLVIAKNAPLASWTVLPPTSAMNTQELQRWCMADPFVDHYICDIGIHLHPHHVISYENGLPEVVPVEAMKPCHSNFSVC